MIEVFSAEEYPQGSDAWFRLRAGLPTASEFSVVLAKVGPRGGTTHKEYVGRVKYLRKLAYEIITGEPHDTEWEGNRHTERGHAVEPEARDYFCMAQDCEVQQVSFVRNGNMGASPDSLVGENSGLELKTALGHIQISRLLDPVMPTEHKPQVQGSMLVTERESWWYMSYSRGLPPLLLKIHRDEQYISELREAIERFNAELDALVTQIRALQ